jgi:MoaA/NifB/PqqE/SkfB family radical SAM enzyme
MSPEVVTAVGLGAAQLAPTARVEFAMHGEPLMHPRHLDIFSEIRGFLPKAQLMVTTNGKVLMRHMQRRLDKVFTHGVDFIILDTYEPERSQLQTEARALDASIQVKDFYTDLAPRGWLPWTNHGRKYQRLVVLMDDLALRSGEQSSRVMHNSAGNNPLLGPMSQPHAKTCTLPFRDITVCHNGNVNICCNDWGGEFVAGNVLENTLAEIWWGEKFEAARRLLQAKNRTFNPCVWCDRGSGSYVGLLPKYPVPTENDFHIVQTVINSVGAINGTQPVQVQRRNNAQPKPKKKATAA